MLFLAVDAIFKPFIFSEATNGLGIAVCHTIFNVLCTITLMPVSSILEKIAIKIIPDNKAPEMVAELDERLLITPPLALERSRMLACDMANAANEALVGGIACLTGFTEDLAAEVKRLEDRTDHLEDVLGTYLVKLSTQSIGESNSAEAAGLLKLIGDFERIGDHATSLVAAGRELKDKDLQFSQGAKEELEVICDAVKNVAALSIAAFVENDVTAAANVEALEELVDDLKDELRSRHIKRLQQGNCSIEVGFVWADLLTNLERISDHCSNIAACVIDMAQHNMNLHESVRSIKANDNEFKKMYAQFAQQYKLP